MKRLALVKDVTDFWKVYEPMFKEYSIDVVTLDIFNYEDQQRILNEEWDGFIWRPKHDPHIRNLAKRFIYFFDQELKIKTFPSWNSYWHYDDKIAQYQLFTRFNIPTPKTNIFFNKEEAIEFVSNIGFPLVYKASTGAGSSNVGLLKNKSQAKRYIKKAFGKGIETFFKEDLQRGYVYFQEYLKNNDGDYRIVCYGNERISGFFRYNRDNAKFASGSGKFNFNPLPEDLLEFTYKVHQQLGSKPVMSYDILKDNSNNWVITEISVVFGDINIWDVYRKAPTYKIENNYFKRLDENNKDHEYFIDLLLKKWGWID